MLARLRSILDRIKTFEKVVAERDQLQSDYDSVKRTLDGLYVPPGHFFSPLPDLDEIRRDDARIFGAMPTEIPGIDMRASQQMELVNALCRFYPELPFTDAKKDGLRYHYVNDAYTYGDGILTYCMVRHLAPKRIIEVGSGYSSCLLLDTNDLHFNGAIDLTFIEPYPELLLKLINAKDRSATSIIDKRLQDISLEQFETLAEGDVLFIDSTHVSKIDSDVNYLFFEILPRLNRGVYIHLHDIFYPFEYPKWWVYEGRGWNESYLLRAFLQYNREFSIALMGTYLRHFHTEFFEQHMPLCLKRFGGSIWIRKH